ncbi:toll-like receptor 7 signaling pathway [Mactra antiquata]
MESLSVTVHYTPSDGHEWAMYFKQKLKEYDVLCELNDFTGDFNHQIKSVNVNIFFLTPDFLDYSNWSLMRIMEKHCTMLVLTGIDHEDLEEASLKHNCKEMLDYYIYSLHNTEDSVRDLLISAVALYEDNSHHSRLHVSHSEPVNYKPDVPSSNQDEDGSDLYDTLPRTRQLNEIKDVLYKDGTLYLLLLRKAEHDLHVRIEDQHFSPKQTEYAVYEIPYTETGQVSLTVVHDTDTLGKRVININMPEKDMKHSERPHHAEQHHKMPKSQLRESVNIGIQTDNDSQENSEDVKFTLQGVESKESIQEMERESVYMNMNDVVRPDSTSDNISTNKNKLDTIRELLETETKPLEILCQCLGIERDVQLLDEKMTDMVKSIETLRQLTYIGRPRSIPDTITSTWPTLVHFGAQFNLMNFCDVLLSNPLMFRSCLAPNKDGHMPHDIALLHGHHDLAEHLRHFSDFVSSVERDSGISGLSIGTNTPRLSTISHHLPPSPHSVSDSGYIRMSKEYHEEDLYDHDQTDSRHMKSPISKFRRHEDKFSGSYDGSFEEDDLYMDMSSIRDSSSVKSMALDHSYHRTHHETIKETEYVDMSPSPISEDKRRFVERTTIVIHDDDDESEPEEEHHRKDVVSMLGITPEQMTANNLNLKKKSKIFGFLSKTKHRSKSEPVFNPELLTTLNNQKKLLAKKRCESERSSTASSTASTYSNASSVKDDEDKNVEVREKKKAKKKMTGFLSRAKKRESMRISHVKGDQHLQAPKLPPRKKSTTDEVF